MTYSLVLVGSVADQFGDTISQDNAGIAASLAGMAEQLTPLE
jgi:hypothetical protein